MGIIAIDAKKHKLISKYIKYFCIIAVIALMIIAFYNNTANYFATKSFLSASAQTNGEIHFEKITEEYHRKLGVRETYHFSYTYQVDGKEYTGKFIAKEDEGKEVQSKKSLVVAYDKEAPEISQPLYKAEKNVDFLTIIGRLIMGLLAIPLIGFFMYFLIAIFILVPKVDGECS